MIPALALLVFLARFLLPVSIDPGKNTIVAGVKFPVAGRTGVVPVRGLSEPEIVRFGVWQSSEGERLFFFPRALPEAVANAHAHGWQVADEWMVPPDPVRTPFEPLAAYGIPFRPMGTYVFLSACEWEAIPTRVKDREVYVIDVLFPNLNLSTEDDCSGEETAMFPVAPH